MLHVTTDVHASSSLQIYLACIRKIRELVGGSYRYTSMYLHVYTHLKDIMSTVRTGMSERRSGPALLHINKKLADLVRTQYFN